MACQINIQVNLTKEVQKEWLGTIISGVLDVVLRSLILSLKR